ncbi:hypothetical protein BAUCODRAFT_33067 [Baudoinia panamericana UAMH 10762]|uniref:HSF-type DNA-binding domain-containing protein n=1 Tax=Baudoinia panamericana (strain UAMH 10762) TaxID=717646 RepID=M2NEF6_BAUPA|nr:uncharacterized protein BAUCODRAFT_33067 [Baudoinia panamericana UAMH 10762]EMC97345.1 hypothetical protein BAUCODRAFT_33067 [Baudoinia panamericana UAMH 10762]
MQQSPVSRKRPAPGTSPMPPQQQQQQQHQSQPSQAPAPSYPVAPSTTDYGNFDFSQPYAADGAFSDANLSTQVNDASYYQNSVQPNTYTPNGLNGQATSTDLVRRARNQPVVAHTGGGVPPGQWDGGGFGSAPGPGEEEDEEELKAKVAMAKRDAQGKRKQIPPFVQKLSSFLDSNNTDLIRWSDDGRSFIVLDEDEFARTLIPELFKHNNYASFVRQLNMYGFHKTVNITDGSLRQSEKARKGVKPPSMYSHPYFRRNQPELLWLIQKPVNKAGGKRKRDGNIKDQYDSDDERMFSPVPGLGAGSVGELGAPGAAQDLVTLPRTELASVRRELQKLQTQQRYISQMIAQLKDQNEQFYRQASAFQALHDRHENSINAILTFLATFYNRSLEGHGAQNLVNMFNNSNQNTQPQGSVEEVTGDGATENNQQLQRFVKKQPLLLPGPLANLQQQQQQTGSAVTAPNSARTSVSPPNGSLKRESTSSVPPVDGGKTSESTASPIIKNDAPTPDLLHSVPENDQMMSLINSVNATNAASASGEMAPALDFSSALEHYQRANGNAPLTPQQRDNMLSLIANQHAVNSGDGNNALISPHPPQMPDLNRMRETQQQLEMLTNMQRQQDEKVQDLHRRLQPLSPTGSIPGLQPSPPPDLFDLTGAPGDYDPNAYFNFDDTSWQNPDAAGVEDGGAASAPEDLNFDFGAPVDGGDINWEFNGGLADEMFTTSPSNGFANNVTLSPQQGQQKVQHPASRVESLSSEATSPATTAVPEVVDEPSTPRKRVRT